MKIQKQQLSLYDARNDWLETDSDVMNAVNKTVGEAMRSVVAEMEISFSPYGTACLNVFGPKIMSESADLSLDKLLEELVGEFSEPLYEENAVLAEIAASWAAWFEKAAKRMRQIERAKAKVVGPKQ